MRKKALVFFTILVLINLIFLCTSKSTDYLDLKWEYSANGAVIFVHVDDLNDDGFKEIVVGASREIILGGSGWVYLLDRDGNLKWKYDLPGPISAMLVDDLDNDGKKEIISGVFSYVHVLDSNGNLKWKSRTDYQYKVMSLYADDIDNDNSKEIVIGTGSQRKGKLFIFDENGSWIKQWEVNGEVRSLYTADLYKNGLKEIIIGTVGKYGVLNYPGYVQVFNTTGSKIWEHQTEKGILSLLVDDINNDGWNEILVGCQEYFYALDNYGNEEGNSTTGGRIRVILVKDLDKDGVKEIILGSNDVYVLDKNFNRKWINTVGSEVYDVGVADLDNDEDLEVIVASDKLYILDKNGKEKWQYPVGLSVTSIYTNDINDDGYQELVIGSLDKNLYVFQSESYVKRLDAKRYYTQAENFYAIGNYKEAKKNAEDAKKIYSELEDSRGIKDCDELLNKIMDLENNVVKEMESARDYYENASNAYTSGDYRNAFSYAYKAKYKYLSFSDTENVKRCNDIINGSIEFLRLDADSYFENASEYYKERNYETALKNAEMAREFYEFIKDNGAVNKSGELIVKINEAIEKKSGGFSFKGDLITPILLSIIIPFLIIIIFLIIKRKEQKIEKPKEKIIPKESKIKVGDEKKIIKEKIEKKVIKRKLLDKIVKDRFKGEGSSLRSLMNKDELKEV